MLKLCSLVLLLLCPAVLAAPTTPNDLNSASTSVNEEPAFQRNEDPQHQSSPPKAVERGTKRPFNTETIIDFGSKQPTVYKRPYILTEQRTPQLATVASSSNPPAPAVASTSNLRTLSDTAFGPNQGINIGFSPEQVQTMAKELGAFRYYNYDEELDKILLDILSQNPDLVPWKEESADPNRLRAVIFEARTVVDASPDLADMLLAHRLSTVLPLSVEVAQQAISLARVLLPLKTVPELQYYFDDNEMDDRILRCLSKFTRIQFKDFKEAVAYAERNIYIGSSYLDDVNEYHIRKQIREMLSPEYRKPYDIMQALKTVRQEIKLEKMEMGAGFDVDTQLANKLATHFTNDGTLTRHKIANVVNFTRWAIMLHLATTKNKLGALSNIKTPDQLKKAIRVSALCSHIECLEILLKDDRTTDEMATEALRIAISTDNSRLLDVVVASGKFSE